MNFFKIAPALLLLAVAGCGGDGGPARTPVVGTITLDGKPLPSGTITFAPLEGRTAATTEVKDGAFRIGSSGGPAPGRYQVEIVSVAPTGKRVPHPDLPTETIEEVRNLVPPRYNAQSTLTADVRADGENAFTFALMSKSDARPRGTRRR